MSADMSMGGQKIHSLENLNQKQVETVAQDFSYTYKQKAEAISKEIR